MTVVFQRLFIVAFSINILGSLCSHITLEPGTSEVFREVSDSYVVSCEVRSDSRPTWKRDGKAIKGVLSERIHTENILKPRNSSLLVLSNLKLSDSGRYSCHSKEFESTFKLTIFSKIIFKDTPTVQTGRQGDNPFVVRCEAEGTPAPVITWGSGSGRSLDGPKFEVAGDGLLIYNLLPEDADTYICRAIIMPNKLSFSTLPIAVNVEYAPKIVNPTERTVYKKGHETIELECQVESFPAPSIKWYFKNSLIENTTNFLNVTFPGEYQCLAANALGNVTQTFFVREGRVPFKPEKPKPHSITTSSIALDVKTRNSTHPITGYLVELRDKKGKYKKALNITNDPPLIITDLTPGTTYVIRTKALNVVGHSEYSLEVEATTGGSSLISSSSIIVILSFFVSCSLSLV